MIDLEESLSRYIDGDLEVDEAEALRVRIANEPEVARHYGELLAVVRELQELPDELPVPNPPARNWGMAGWAVAVLAAGWILWPHATPQLQQNVGTTTYDGEYRVLAGPLEVEIDGVVSVGMEPRRGVARVKGQEESMKLVTHGIAAAAGALVTVTVSQGTAMVRGDDGQVVQLAAGEAREFGGDPGARRPLGPGSTVGSSSRVAELEAELASVKKALGEERFAKVLMKGQLDAERGSPTEWPVELDTRLTPQGFPAELEALVADIPNVELVTTNCEEYPCIGALQFTGPADDLEWGRPMGTRISEWAEQALDGNAALSIANIEDGGDKEAPNRFLVFSAHGEGRQSNVAQRAGRRMEEVGMSLIEQP